MKLPSDTENTAGSDFQDRLIRSLWARRFLLDCPTGYDEAIRRAGEPVDIYESDETGELQWVVALEDGFWMDSFPTQAEAENLVKEMGWPIIGSNVQSPPTGGKEA